MLRFLIVCFFPGWAFAQNLVSNPGFENMLREPESGVCTHIKQSEVVEQTVHDWRSFVWATADVIVVDSTNEACLPMQPRTGRVMGGIYQYVPAAEVGLDEGYREFLIGTLTAPLVKGQKYEFAVWVQLNNAIGGEYLKQAYSHRPATAGFAASHLGVQFTIGRPAATDRFLQDSRQFGEKPHVEFKDLIETDSTSWLLLSATFTAWYPYRYFVIGNFAYDNRLTIAPREPFDRIGAANKKLTGPTKNHRTYRLAYYCLDDFYVGPPRLHSQLAAGQPFTFEQLAFATGSTTIQPGSARELDELVDWLQNNPTARLHITGHTDNVGTATANQTLSRGRADAVKNYLTTRGIVSHRLTSSGKGATEPVATNDTTAGRQRNRRVEIGVVERGE